MATSENEGTFFETNTQLAKISLGSETKDTQINNNNER
jgi:hypothetical protein